tara:strand:+ start:570 stop:722 length:153 start_codon:yes stop_codon:yes gene_type:complete
VEFVEGINKRLGALGNLALHVEMENTVNPNFTVLRVQPFIRFVRSQQTDV